MVVGLHHNICSSEKNSILEHPGMYLYFLDDSIIRLHLTKQQTVSLEECIISSPSAPPTGAQKLFNRTRCTPREAPGGGQPSTSIPTGPTFKVHLVSNFQVYGAPSEKPGQPTTATPKLRYVYHIYPKLDLVSCLCGCNSVHTSCLSVPVATRSDMAAA